MVGGKPARMAGSFHSLFPTRVFIGKLPGAAARRLNPALLRDVAALSREDHMGRDWSKENYRGGYTSYASLSDLQFRTPAFAELGEFLQRQAEKFAQAEGWDMRGLKLRLTAFWMNVMPRHTYHPLHIHPGSVLSGTYYLQSPAGSSRLKIEDPRMGFLMNAPVKRPQRGKSNSLYFQVEPKPGSFVLFESWVRHEVPPTESARPRISLSFNFELE